MLREILLSRLLRNEQRMAEAIGQTLGRTIACYLAAIGLVALTAPALALLPKRVFGRGVGLFVGFLATFAIIVGFFPGRGWASWQFRLGLPFLWVLLHGMRST